MAFQYAMLALSAVQAINSISQGYSEKDESGYNAGLLGEKAEAINLKKQMDYAQYERLKGKTYSKSMANIAAMGIKPTGSAMAVVLNAQNQITIDQVISSFNIEQEKRFTIGQAEAEKRAGKQKVKAGYSSAFSSILSGVTSYAQYTKGK